MDGQSGDGPMFEFPLRLDAPFEGKKLNFQIKISRSMRHCSMRLNRFNRLVIFLSGIEIYIYIKGLPKLTQDLN